jgi:hypothetical protein
VARKLFAQNPPLTGGFFFAQRNGPKDREETGAVSAAIGANADQGRRVINAVPLPPVPDFIGGLF